MSRLVVVAWALAWVVFATPRVEAETRGGGALVAGNAASQNADRPLKLAAEGGEPDTGKQQTPFYLGPVTVNVMPPGLLAVHKELVFWDSIKASRDPADFDDFLRRFPDSDFASLARRRLAALRPPPPARPAAAPAEGEAGWTIGERREVQRALRARPLPERARWRVRSGNARRDQAVPNVRGAAGHRQFVGCRTPEAH